MRLFGRAPPPYRFAPLTPAEADSCAALHGRAFAQGWPALEFERLIASRSSWSDAVVDGRTEALVGFALSRGAAGEAEMLTIAVDEAWRGRGIGMALLAQHMRQLAANGIAELFLEVAEDNKAGRRLYGKAGFASVGRREAYYRSQAATAGATAALIMRRSLA